MRRTFLIMAIVTVLGIHCALPGQAQDTQKVDAVYLLDVSVSMVGQGGSPNDIMEGVIDALIQDIKSFDQGRIVFMTFANGLHDLDHGVAGIGDGLIRSKYTFTIQEQGDKQQVYRFLRPSEYEGNFHDPETGEEIEEWQGVYKATEEYGGHRTAIWDSLNKALNELKQLQHDPRRRETHDKPPHVQKIVLLTDGRDNASELSYDDIKQKLDLHNSAMQKPFFYTQYYIGQTPPPCPKDSYSTCVNISDLPIVKIKLDRHKLISPSNIWVSPSVSVQGVEFEDIVSSQSQLHKLDKAEVTVEAKGFDAVPDGISFDVSITDKAAKPPLKEDEEFDVTVSLSGTDHQALRKWLRKQEKDKGSLSGHLTFSTTSKQSNFEPETIPVEIRYRRPKIDISTETRANAYCFNISPNNATQRLNAEQLSLSFVFNSTHFNLGSGAGERVNPRNPELHEKICFSISSGLDTGSYHGDIGITSSNPDILFNNQKEYRFSYDFAVVGFDRESLDFPNLWIASSRKEGKKRVVTIEDIRLFGLPEWWDWQQFSIIPKDFHLPVGIQPTIAKSPKNGFDLKMTVSPYKKLRSRKDRLNRQSQDGRFKMHYAASDNTKRIVFQSANLPVNLVYRRLLISLRCTKNKLRAQKEHGNSLSPSESVLTVDATYSEDLKDLERSLRLYYDKGQLYATNSNKNRIKKDVFRGETLTFHIDSDLPAGLYEGEIDVQSTHPNVMLQRGTCPTFPYEYTYNIPRTIETPKHIQFRNLWIYGTYSNGNWQAKPQSLEFKNLPDQGQIVFEKGAFGLPTGTELRLIPSRISASAAEKVDLKAQLKGAARLLTLGRTQLSGPIKLSYNKPQGLDQAPVSFSTDSVSVSIDLTQPQITAKVNGSVDKPQVIELGEVGKSEDVLKLNFIAMNTTFSRLSSQHRKVIIEYPEDQFEMLNANGEVVSDTTISPTQVKMLRFRVKSSLSFGKTYDGSISVSPKSKAMEEVIEINNGRGEYSQGYRFRLNKPRLTVDPEIPNGDALPALGTVNRGQLALCLNLSANQVFRELPNSQKTVIIRNPQDHFKLVDQAGTRLDRNRINVSDVHSVCFQVKQGLDLGKTYNGNITIQPAKKRVWIDDHTEKMELAYNFKLAQARVEISTRKQAPSNSLEVFEFSYNETSKEAAPIKVTYPPDIFVLKRQGVTVQSGSRLSQRPNQLTLTASPGIGPGILPKTFNGTVEYTAPKNVKIQGRKVYQLSITYESILASPFLWIGRIAIILGALWLLVEVIYFCLTEQVGPVRAIIEFATNHLGPWMAIRMPLTVVLLGLILMIAQRFLQ